VNLVSDGTGTAEVTLLYQKINPEVPLPRLGESVDVIGVGYRKVLGGTKNPYSFAKVFANCISTITVEKEMELAMEGAGGRQRRTNYMKVTDTIELLEPQKKKLEFESSQERLDLRTLVMIFCYYVFEHNTDIQSYIFNPEMIVCSKAGRHFMTEFGVAKGSLEAALARTLQELANAGYLAEKDSSEGSKQPFFVIKRELLRGLEKDFEEKISSS
jgi:hypothetical protein